MLIKQIYDWKNLSGVIVRWWQKREVWSAPLVALPKSNSASKHSEVWVSFNPLQWQAPSYPDYSKKKKKKKKKLLVIRSGCVELSKRRKRRLIIISKLTGLRVIQTFTELLKSKIFYQAVDLKGLFSEK